MGKGLYSYQWNKARLAFLKRHPLCVVCKDHGRVVASSVVDHIQPHKGDTALFWDRSNWQALCKHCHDSHKQRIEKRAASGVVIEPRPEVWGGHVKSSGGVP